MSWQLLPGLNTLVTLRGSWEVTELTPLPAPLIRSYLFIGTERLSEITAAKPTRLRDRFKTYTSSAYLGHGRHEIAPSSRLELVNDCVGRQGSHPSDALHVLVGQMGLSLLFPLGKCHIQRL